MNSGLYIEATRIGFLAILVVHQLPHHLGNVFGVDLGAINATSDFDFLLSSCVRFFLCDKAVFQHPVDDVELPRPTPALGC